MHESKRAVVLWSLFLVTLAMPGCAGTKSNTTVVIDEGGVGDGLAAARHLAPQPGQPVGDGAKEEVSELASPQARCLKEGEFCNPLYDTCCYGYYCPGGLAPRCWRKP